MPLVETRPVGPDTAQWELWSTTARIVVTDPALRDDAAVLAQCRLAEIERACSRFRSDSELMSLPAGRPVRVSPLLAQLVAAALEAAATTDGLVTPTLGGVLAGLGYAADWSQVRDAAGPTSIAIRRAPGWRQVRLDGRELTIPYGMVLDLGATGKALAADLVAADIARALPTGVLVALGGDIATAGPAPTGGWNVLVQDRPGDPAVTVALPAGGAIATSSTQGRRWRRGAEALHHVIDPRSCRPAATVWRTATVATRTCVAANTASTAALILGHDAPGWLGARGAAARLVPTVGPVRAVCGFPADPTQERCA